MSVSAVYCAESTYFWEIHQNFSHLITTLSATNVHNDVTVGELGQGLGDDGLAASKRTGNADSTTLNAWEERVKHTLADDERLVGRKLLG